MKADVKQINRFLSRDDILNAKDLKREEFNIPEWGGKVIIQSLDGFGRDEYMKSLNNKDSFLSERLVIASVIDEQGNKIFNESDAEMLKKKNGWIVARICIHIDKMNATSGGAVKDAEKN